MFVTNSYLYAGPTRPCTSSSTRRTSYTAVCASLGIEKLSTRREAITLRFARKTATKSRHSDLFEPNPVNCVTRNNTPKYRQYNCHTTRKRETYAGHRLLIHHDAVNTNYHLYKKYTTTTTTPLGRGRLSTTNTTTTPL